MNKKRRFIWLLKTIWNVFFWKDIFCDLFATFLRFACNNTIEDDVYELIIPNKEVYQIYKNSFMDYFKDYTNERKENFVKVLIDEKEDEENQILSDILMKSISYYDNNEAFYHGLLLGLLSHSITDSNKEIWEGRADIIIYPLTFNGKVIIIECKHSIKDDNIVLDSQKAVQQIIDRKYLEGALAIGYKEAIGYGIAFYKKKCKITIVNKGKINNISKECLDD